MAYELKYELGYNSLQTTGKVSIYEESGTPGSETLTLRSDSLKINYNWNGWEDPIIGLTASFSIVNEKDDFFELLPLLTAEERKYKIVIARITPSSLTLFEGYLNCADNEQKYLHKQDIRLNASSYLSKLQYINAPTIEILEDDTFINIIDDCLVQTGANDDIFINCRLYPVGISMTSSHTLFNKCGIYKEVFWKDNIERDSALDVLKKILTAFDCYLFWGNGYWYIERYADIWNGSTVNYVRYTTGTDYLPGDSGSTSAVVPDVHDFADQVKMNTSQTIKIIVGKKQVEMNIEQQLLFNLVVNNFEDATIITGAAVPYPAYRQWDLYDSNPGGGSSFYWPIWSLTPPFGRLRGGPFRNISKAIYRSGYEPDNGGYKVECGMYTRFRATVTEETVLSIKFKYGLPFHPFYSYPGWGHPDVGTENYQFRFYWYLRNPPGNYYIVFNDISEEWERVVGSEVSGLQSKYVNGAEIDMQLYTLEVNFSIPIHQVFDSGVWGGDQDFILGIGTEEMYDPWGDPHLQPGCFYGDIEVTCNSPVVDNYISGEVNTNFLDKLTLTQPFVDSSDLGIRNAIMFGQSELYLRTETWDDDLSSSGEGLDLAEMKIKDKFRLYNISRQMITADLQNTFLYKPFSRFTDSNQADSSGGEGLHLVLVGVGYEPQQDLCAVTLSEYDNEEDINLI